MRFLISEAHNFVHRFKSHRLQFASPRLLAPLPPTLSLAQPKLSHAAVSASSPAHLFFFFLALLLLLLLRDIFSLELGPQYYGKRLQEESGLHHRVAILKSIDEDSFHVWQLVGGVELVNLAQWVEGRYQAGFLGI